MTGKVLTALNRQKPKPATRGLQLRADTLASPCHILITPVAVAKELRALCQTCSLATGGRDGDRVGTGCLALTTILLVRGSVSVGRQLEREGGGRAGRAGRAGRVEYVTKGDHWIRDDLSQSIREGILEKYI